MGFCDLPGAGLLCDVVSGGVGDSITTSIGNWIAKSAGDLAKSAVDMASRAVDTTTAVDLNADWFRHNYELVLPIGLVMLVMTFCLQLARAAWRRDGQALGQAVTGTISGVIFSFTAIAFTTVALTVVDALSRGLFQLAGTSVDDAVRRIVKVSLVTSVSQLGWAIAAVTALGCAVGAILYWGMMIFRKVSIIIMVILAPFAGAGGGWEPAQRWRRSWIEATATLVFSKLVMTVVFLVGTSAIGESNAKDGLSALSDIVAGIVVMALVLLCPFAVYKFVHWAGDGQAHDLHRGTAAGLSVASGAAKQAATKAMAGGAGGAAAGAAPQGPSKVPGMNESSGMTSGADPSGSQNATQTSFRYPGGSGSPGESGDGGQNLIRRPGQPQAGPQHTGGDGGQPLIQRATPPTESGSTSSGSPSTPARAVPAASGPILSGAPRPSGTGSTPPAASAASSPTGQRFTFPNKNPS